MWHTHTEQNTSPDGKFLCAAEAAASSPETNVPGVGCERVRLGPPPAASVKSEKAHSERNVRTKLCFPCLKTALKCRTPSNLCIASCRLGRESQQMSFPGLMLRKLSNDESIDVRSATRSWRFLCEYLYFMRVRHISLPQRAATCDWSYSFLLKHTTWS